MSNILENSFLPWLSEEISERMGQKLGLIKTQPRHTFVVDQDSTRGLKLLRNFYPNADLFATAQNAGGLINLLKNLFGKGIPKFHRVARNSTGGFELPSEHIDLLWVNAWRFSHDQAWKAELQEWHRVLRSDGLLMFSYLGPDTGKELRVLENPGPVLGLDMHDMGDGLAQTGFAGPVMDMEYLTLTYQDASLFIRDAQALGLIPQKQFSAQTEAQIQQLKTTHGEWRMTIEVVYGHAWWAKPRFGNISTIRPEDIKIKSK